jgi:hypothetical protein
MAQSCSLHGYQPIVVDEDCLNDEDCKESLLEALHAIASGDGSDDWRSYLTPEELAAFEKELAALRTQEKKSPFISNGESPAVTEKKFEMARLGILRRFARNKYNGGRRIYFGDGPPPWHRSVE